MLAFSIYCTSLQSKMKKHIKTSKNKISRAYKIIFHIHKKYICIKLYTHKIYVCITIISFLFTSRIGSYAYKPYTTIGFTLAIMTEKPLEHHSNNVPKSLRVTLIWATHPPMMGHRPCKWEGDPQWGGVRSTKLLQSAWRASNLYQLQHWQRTVLYCHSDVTLSNV